MMFTLTFSVLDLPYLASFIIWETAYIFDFYLSFESPH